MGDNITEVALPGSSVVTVASAVVAEVVVVVVAASLDVELDPSDP